MLNRFHSYINYSEKLITQFKGDMPFAIYLKSYFKENKKHGSKDRKQIAHLCYCYFRLGNAFSDLEFVERIKIAIYLCNQNIDGYKILFEDEWLNKWNENLLNRIKFIETKYGTIEQDLFPNTNLIGGISDKINFVYSHLNQPNLYLRVRPGNEKSVFQKLLDNDVNFNVIKNTCIECANGSKVDEILKINEEVVIQDYNSQQISLFFDFVKNSPIHNIKVWDCCAASGGKSILAIDYLNKIKLTVSDSRASILHNLKKRFETAQIKNYTSFVADLAKPISLQNKFNLIICDVPCSGSGTWSRTPEFLKYFKESDLEKFNFLQNNITKNVIEHLDINGYLLYVTCSVFKSENEDVVDEIIKNYNLKLIHQQYLEGFEMKADTLFAALLQKKY